MNEGERLEAVNLSLGIRIHQTVMVGAGLKTCPDLFADPLKKPREEDSASRTGGDGIISPVK